MLGFRHKQSLSALPKVNNPGTSNPNLATAADAALNYVPRYAIHELTVYDPAFQKASVITFDYEKFEREVARKRSVDFFLTREVAKTILLGEGVVVSDNALSK